MQVNFKLLSAFIAVAEKKSFRAAAAILNKSESSVSAQIKELEYQLGVVLFHRTTRMVKITKDGSELLTYAQKAIAEWNTGIRHVQRASDLQNGIVSIACIPTVAYSRLPDALVSFHRQFPNVIVNVREHRMESMIDALHKDEVDLAIGINFGNDNELRFEPLFDDQIVALGAKSFFEVVGQPIEFEHLCRLPLLTHPRRTAYRALFEGEAQIKSSDLNVKFDTLGAQTTVAFALRGLGVAILPKSAVPPNLDDSIQEVPIIRPFMVRPIGIISFRDKFHAPLIEQLRREMRVAFTEAGPHVASSHPGLVSSDSFRV